MTQVSLPPDAVPQSEECDEHLGFDFMKHVSAKSLETLACRLAAFYLVPQKHEALMQNLRGESCAIVRPVPLNEVMYASKSFLCAREAAIHILRHFGVSLWSATFQDFVNKMNDGCFISWLTSFDGRTFEEAAELLMKHRPLRPANWPKKCSRTLQEVVRLMQNEEQKIRRMSPMKHAP